LVSPELGRQKIGEEEIVISQKKTMRLTSHRNSRELTTNKYQKNQEIYFKLSREYKLHQNLLLTSINVSVI